MQSACQPIYSPLFILGRAGPGEGGGPGGLWVHSGSRWSSFRFSSFVFPPTTFANYANYN